MCLQLIPVAAMFFLLTTPIGSALWAVNLEEQKRRVREADGDVRREAVGQGVGVVGGDEEAQGQAPPPAYTDDPI